MLHYAIKNFKPAHVEISVEMCVGIAVEKSVENWTIYNVFFDAICNVYFDDFISTLISTRISMFTGFYCNSKASKQASIMALCLVVSLFEKNYGES